jgi:hypothetical protein
MPVAIARELGIDLDLILRAEVEGLERSRQHGRSLSHLS